MAPHSPTMIPYLTVQDAAQSLNFYQDAFAFTLKEAAKDSNGEITHVEMSYRDVLIMFAPEGAYNAPIKAPRTLGVMPSICLYFYCDDVDQFYQKALEAGAISLMAPHDSFWGDRVCQVADLNGFHWMWAHKLS